MYGDDDRLLQSATGSLKTCLLMIGITSKLYSVCTQL